MPALFRPLSVASPIPHSPPSVCINPLELSKMHESHSAAPGRSELGSSLTLRAVYGGFFGVSRKQKALCAHWSPDTAELSNDK